MKASGAWERTKWFAICSAPQSEKKNKIKIPVLFISRGDARRKQPTTPWSKGRRATQETSGGPRYLDTLVLLGCELVGADGSHGDVGSDQVLVPVQEGEGVHPAERGADHHRRGQAQTLAHLPQEGSGRQFSHGSRGFGRLGLTESWGRLEKVSQARVRPTEQVFSSRKGDSVVAPGLSLYPLV